MIKLIVLGIWIIGALGWTMNVYKLTQLDFKAPYKAERIRVVGVFPLVGAITGYMTINDKEEQ